MYDLVIMGLGPAGLTAAIYSARYRLKVAAVGEVIGGAIGQGYTIENYPGTGKISGLDLGENMVRAAKEFGAEIIPGKIEKITKESASLSVKVGDKILRTKRVLVAIGCERIKLQIPGEEQFTGKGVSYCATCDGFFFKEKTVAVVGGGDSAITAAIYLSDLAKKVYILYRGEKLKAEPHWLKKLEKIQNVEIKTTSNLVKIEGDTRVTGVALSDGTKISLDGVFIEIGSAPNETILAGLNINRDEKGYIHVDDEFKTNIAGVWAAGDITYRKMKLRQVVTAAGEGAQAAYSVFLDSKR